MGEDYKKTRGILKEHAKDDAPMTSNPIDTDALARAMMKTVFHEIDVSTASTDWTGNDVWGCDFEEMAQAAVDHLKQTHVSIPKEDLPNSDTLKAILSKCQDASSKGAHTISTLSETRALLTLAALVLNQTEEEKENPHED